jgi:hypothetical protein
MRVAIRIQSHSDMYLAALHGSHPILTPYRCDAGSFRDEQSAADALRSVRSLGYTATLEDVAW